MWRITDLKNTLKFHFHTQKLELLCTALKKGKRKVLHSGFHLNGQTSRDFVNRGRTEVKVSLHAIDQGG